MLEVTVGLNEGDFVGMVVCILVGDIDSCNVGVEVVPFMCDCIVDENVSILNWISKCVNLFSDNAFSLLVTTASCKHKIFIKGDIIISN